MMLQQKQLTFVIVTYNSAQVITNCLNSINSNAYDVIVVDNASKDETVTIIEKKFPWVKLIKIDKNLGYGNGNNVGLEQVKTDFALVLNPDAIISPENIEVVLGAVKQDEMVALAAPPTIKEFSLSPDELKVRLKKIERDFAIKNEGKFKKNGDNYEVPFLVGAVVFMRMSIMRKIGFYDPNIFLYFEDDEICYRVLRNGYKNLLISNAVAFHIPGTSSKPSLRGSYRKGWHLKGWSKLYWCKVRKGAASTWIYGIRLIFFLFFKAFLSAIRARKERALTYIGGACGAFSFLIGLKAFDKNGNPRG